MGKTKEFLKKSIKKVAGLSVLAMVALFLFVGFALQAEAATAKITASSARVRKQASTSSDVVTSVNNGDSFTIQKEVTGSDGYVWYEISVNNQIGYVRSDLAKKSESTTTTTTTTTTNNAAVTEVQPISAKVTGGQVRVRPDASTNGSVVTTVAKDTVVTVNGTADGADGKVWYKVNFRSGNDDITGFIREDFLQLAGALVPVVESTPEFPTVDEPATEVVPDPPVVEVKDYETFESNGKWYLVNNTTSPAYQYVIDDIFKAAETNAALYENSLKKVKTQKTFIMILLLLLVAVGVGATFVIFKMKDMLDEAYYEDVEKEVAAKRQNKQQNVMHTVGKDAAQKKPTVNGQQKPAPKQPVNGQPKQPANGAAKPQQAQAAKPQQAQAAKPQQAQAAKPQQAQAAKPQQAQAAKPQQTQAAKPAAQNAKPKNFIEEDDDFEYDFLNWDGEEEM